MFNTLIESYVHVFAVLLPAMIVVIIAINAKAANLPRRVVVTAASVVAVILGLWYAAATQMARADLFMPPPTLADPPFVLMFMFGGAGLLFVLGRFTATGRKITDAMGQEYLVGFQIPRAMGGIFLIGWALGVIPWQFALPAGLGDIWAGVAGYQAMKAVNNNAPDARRLVIRANVIGLVDFLIAILTGLMTSEGFLHLMSRDAPNIINHYPLALFPGFFVALFMAAHFISLAKLRESRVTALAA